MEKQIDLEKLAKFANEQSKRIYEKEQKQNKARKLLDEGKIKLSEYLEIINQ